MLEDIAILTSGQVVSEDIGIKLENVTVDMLGTAKRVLLTKEKPLSSMAAAIRAISRIVAVRFAPRLMKQPLTMIAKNFRNAWPNCPAASR